LAEDSSTVDHETAPRHMGISQTLHALAKGGCDAKLRYLVQLMY
jgi:hypothetical protein